MNAPLKLARESAPAHAAPLRVRAHLLHRLRSELSPATLRTMVPGTETALPRGYWQKALGASLQDFLGRNSKMFRASMVEWAWRAAGGAGELPEAFPLAVEALHAGSLIIDDIEDGAYERRGDAALHRRYGLAPALNAGNWLYFWPARLLEEAGLTPEQELAALKMVGHTQYRCHLGQGLDVSLKVQDIHQSDMHRVMVSKTALKTGALMGLSAYLGAMAANASEAHCAVYARFGERLGNVLQMLDDSGSIGSEERTEKAREDLHSGTPTWPWAWAAEHLAKDAYGELVKLSCEVQRTEGDIGYLRARLRQIFPADLDGQLNDHLAHALNVIEPVIVRPACIEALHHEFERLRNSYA